MTTDQDTAAVLAALGQLGEPVPWNAARRLVLGGHDALWLVSAGAVELYAADAGGRAALEYLGIAPTGALIAGSLRRPGRLLVARPHQDGALRRVPTACLARRYAPAAAEAIAHGVDAGLRALLPRAPAPPQSVRLEAGRSIELSAGRIVHTGPDVRWVLVQAGQVAAPDGSATHGPGEVLALTGAALIAMADSVLDVRDTHDLLGAGILGPRLADQQEQILADLDARLGERDQLAGERLHAARQAGEHAFTSASTVLRSVAGGAEPDADARSSAFRRVAEAAGITVPDDVTADTVETFAGAVGCRSRSVRLVGRWWREDLGPLIADGPDGAPVALLRRRGRYVLGGPDGSCIRVNADIAAALGSSATMLYRPFPDEPPSGRTLARFALRGAHADLLRLLAGTVVTFGVGLALPVMTGKILGEYVAEARIDLIVQASIGVVVAGVVMAALGMLTRLSTMRLYARADATLQAAVWDRLLRLRTAFFRRFSTGELVNAALGISTIRHIASGVAFSALSAVVIGVVNLALMTHYSGTLTAIAAVLIGVHLVTFCTLGYRQLRWLVQMIELRYALSDLVYQRLRALPKLRVAAAEGFAYAHWADQFARAQQLSRRMMRAQTAMAIVNGGYLGLCSLLIYALIAGPLRGTLSVAGFLSWSAAFGATVGAATQATGLLTSVGVIAPIYKKLRPILDEIPETTGTAADPGALSGAIDLTDVSFRYAPDGPLVLDRLSLSIAPGEFVAIVGATGSGKSTLLRLLLGFETATSGTLAYDQRDIRGLDHGAVRRQCGVVLQNAAPFAGTILDNIRGTGDATTEQAWEAAALAGLDADINRMPMGMFSAIPDGGVTLSGGQRQRLLIAQALTRKPRFLLLDEATSALDNQTQHTVTRTIRAIDATRIVIAHRLSTVLDADRVIVLHGGRVIEQGTPAQLLSNADGKFQQLVQRQL